MDARPDANNSTFSKALSSIGAEKLNDFKKNLETRLGLSKQDKERMGIPEDWILPTLCQFCEYGMWQVFYTHNNGYHLELSCFCHRNYSYTFKTFVPMHENLILIECDGYYNAQIAQRLAEQYMR